MFNGSTSYTQRVRPRPTHNFQRVKKDIILICKMLVDLHFTAVKGVLQTCCMHATLLPMKYLSSNSAGNRHTILPFKILNRICIGPICSDLRMKVCRGVDGIIWKVIQFFARPTY